jgi:hypothetical protein
MVRIGEIERAIADFRASFRVDDPTVVPAR